MTIDVFNLFQCVVFKVLMIIRLDRIEIRTLRVLITDIQRISSYQRKTTFVNKFPKSFPFDNLMLFELSNGDKEIRTPDPLLARQVLSQLSYTPKLGIKLNQSMVGTNGLEPSTSRLSGVRSNQLSYKPMNLASTYSPIPLPV